METGTVKLWDYSKSIKARHSEFSCGPYYFVRQPLRSKGDRCKGFSGYLSRDGKKVEGLCILRVVTAHDVLPNSIRHRGWFCDEDRDQTMYGALAILPRRRGFLAGWSMGENMVTSFGGDIYDNERDAALAADGEARSAAEEQIEYEAKERADIEAEEALEELRSGVV